MHAKILFSAWHNYTKVSNYYFIIWAPPNVKIQKFCIIFYRTPLCKCKCASGSLNLKTDSQRSLWNWFLLSCTYDFHELMSVMQTNLKKKTEFACEEESVYHKSIPYQPGPTWSIAVQHHSIQTARKGHSQKWARRDFMQYGKWKHVLKGDPLKVKVKCKI